MRTESVVNDGTALVLYTIAVGAAASGRNVSLALVSAEFAESAAGPDLRRLSLHLGSEIDGYAAAALDGSAHWSAAPPAPSPSSSLC